MEPYEDEETVGERQEEAYARLAEFFQTYVEDHDNHIYMYEFAMWMYFLFFRMRQTLKAEELAVYVGNTLGLVETALRQSREEEDSTIIIAEDWRDIEGGLEMIQALSLAATAEDLTVPEEWET